MNHDLLNGSRSLARRALHRLDLAIGDRIECLTGCLWVTHDGDPRDVILEAGQGHVVDRATPLLVSALEASRYLALRAA